MGADELDSIIQFFLMGADESKQNAHCCPDGSWPALRTDYKGKGVKTSLGGTTVYQVGEGKKALVMVSDIFGASSGRHQAVADNYAQLGYNVFLPQLLIKPYEGPMEMDPIIQCIIDQNFQKMEARFASVVTHLEKNGMAKFHCVGFCWGVWMAFKLAAKYPQMVSIAGMHPSLGLEQKFKGDPVKLAESILCPALLLPAGNDPANIKEGGDIVKVLAKKFGDKTSSFTYPDMEHGWVVRGDLKDEKVMRDVGDAIKRSHTYFSQFDL